MRTIHNSAPGTSGIGGWTVYLQRNVYTPAIGRALALRTLFEDRIRIRQATGLRTGLNTRLGGDGPRLAVSILHDNLAAFEAFRDGLAAEPGYAEFGEQVEEHLGAHAETSLSRIIVPLPDRSQWGRYVVRVSYAPLLGSASELIALTTDRARLRESQGRSTALVAGAIGTNLITLIIGFRSLAEYEAFQDENREDPTYRAYQERLPALAATVSQELYEVLIATQSDPVRELAGSARR